jgi:hypothetical protein
MPDSGPGGAADKLDRPGWRTLPTTVPCYPLFAADAQLDRLRGDPRFIAFLARIQRDWEQRKSAL